MYFKHATAASVTTSFDVQHNPGRTTVRDGNIATGIIFIVYRDKPFSVRYDGWLTPDCTVPNAQFKLLQRGGNKMQARLWLDNVSVPKVGFVGLASVYDDGDGTGPADPGVYAVNLDSLN